MRKNKSTKPKLAKAKPSKKVKNKKAAKPVTAVKEEKPSKRANQNRAMLSAQQTIPYVRMLPDGVCQLPGGFFTKTLAYEDIN